MKTNIAVGKIIPIVGNYNNMVPVFGDLTLKAKGVHNCTPNTGTELEIGDFVTGWFNLNVFWNIAEYLGGAISDKENSYKPIHWIDMETNCEYVIPVVNADAEVSEWSAWSSCANSLQTRTRTVITAATGTGTTPVLIEEQACVMPVVIIHYVVNNQNPFAITVNWLDENNVFHATVQQDYSSGQYFAIEGSLSTQNDGVSIEIVEQ